MERRFPIAWDCATDEIREVTYNGMAEDLSGMWSEIERLTAESERLRDVAADLMDLVDEMPVKHPQQDTRRKILRGQCEQFGITQQETTKP